MEFEMKKLKCLILVTAIGASFAGSAPTIQNGTNRDIVDTAMSVHQFNTFLMLVRDADLMFDLKGSGPFTIFAPTDAAFDRMPAGYLTRIHENKSRLKNFVLHHVVRGNWTAESAIRAKSLMALDGTKLITQNLNGSGRIGNAGFTIANIRTSNGILHGIDSALIRF